MFELDRRGSNYSAFVKDDCPCCGDIRERVEEIRRGAVKSIIDH